MKGLTPADDGSSYARMLARSSPPLSLRDGYVLSCCSVATAVGVRVLEEGGNAVDAAVATAIALAVTVPEAGNLGGGGFMLIRLATGEVHCLDYRERAPRRLSALDLSDHRRLMGAAAVAVPGTVAGLAAALARFGTWSWGSVVALSIDLADAGITVSARQALFFRLYAAELGAFAETRRSFLPDGRPPLPGTRLRQLELGRTLAILAAEGPAAFYEGVIAERIAAGIARHGGVLDREDLAAYAPRWRTPYTVGYRDRQVHTAALPSGGGLIVAVALKLAEAARLHELAPGSAEHLDLLARLLRVAALERTRWAGDPDELDHDERLALDEILSPASTPAQLVAAAAGATPRAVPACAEGDNTTHFCALDGWGNAVSNTYSLNTRFGSKLIADDTGFLLNNTMDDFVLACCDANYYGLGGSPRNQPAPGRRPAGSMAPTIVSGKDGAELLLGAAGGPRIPSTIVQLVSGVVGHGLTLPDAMRRPRVHHQGTPDVLYVEDGLAAATLEALALSGHRLVPQREVGIGAALRRDATTGQLEAVMDPRYQCRP